MNVLITGGAGYLGSTLVDLLLERGHNVRVFDSLLHGGRSLLAFWHHSCFDFVRGDIRDRALLVSALENMDSVVHLAAIVGDPACARDEKEACEVNLNASLALLENCRRTGTRSFVFASTCSNYGKMRDPDGYVDEDSELAPVSLYAETKVQFEQALLSFGNSGPLVATSLRFATLFGVSLRMRFDLTVNEFTLDILTKNHLVVYGEQFWRPYVHVRDAARAICDVLAAPDCVRSQVFNVGSTRQNFRKKDLVEMLRVYAPEARIEFVDRQDDPRDYRVRFEKIQRQLGFSTTITVQAGIAEVARLVKSNLAPYLEDKSFRN